MYKKVKERYAIGIFVSSIIGALLYLLFSNWIYLAGGLVCGIFFLIKLLMVRKE